MFVLDDFVVRKYMYATGEQTFGISWMLSSDNGFETLKQVIVNEKKCECSEEDGCLCCNKVYNVGRR